MDISCTSKQFHFLGCKTIIISEVYSPGIGKLYKVIQLPRFQQHGREIRFDCTVQEELFKGSKTQEIKFFDEIIAQSKNTLQLLTEDRRNTFSPSLISLMIEN